MLKNNKVNAILSSIVILLPIVIGVVLWDKLPENPATHWDIYGNPDRWGNKGLAMFGLPCILFAVHWFCLFITIRDWKNKEQTRTAANIVFWICPFISCLVSVVVFSAMMEKTDNMMLWIGCAMGAMFVFMGNYLPKIRQNRRLGIKVIWALNSEENWNATHRFGGKVWVIIGILLLFARLLPEKMLIPAVLTGTLIAISVPLIYSYAYYKKHGSGETDVNEAMTKTDRKILVFTVIALVVTFVFVGVITATGTVEIAYEETQFTIQTSYYSDITVAYDTIDEIVYLDNFDKGTRTNGFGSAVLAMGTFRNDDYGSYTLYAYAKCPAAVVLTADGKTLVLNGRDAEQTKQIYETLRDKIN